MKLNKTFQLRIDKEHRSIWIAFKKQVATEQTSLIDLLWKAILEYLEKRNVEIHWE